MIVRELPDGGTAIIAQTDHSKLVGQLAAHWGNDAFARPEPYESVARAATFHDFGWLPYETRPLLNPQTHRPYQFQELPFSPATPRAYQQLLDWLTAVDSYAGLLASKHRTGLWQGRYGALRKPSMQYGAAGSLRPEIQAFIQANEAEQRRLASGLDAAALDVNYRLLQVWDHLGLYFCCRPPRHENIDPVPSRPRQAAGEGVEMRLTPLSHWEVRFEPYPFDVQPLQVQIVHRPMRTATFESQEAWLEAYYSAPLALLTYTLV